MGIAKRAKGIAIQKVFPLERVLPAMKIEPRNRLFIGLPPDYEVGDQRKGRRWHDVPFKSGCKGGNLSRRLERLEAELTPSSDEPALTIVVTSVGKPDEIIEVRGPERKGLRPPWPSNSRGD